MYICVPVYVYKCLHGIENTQSFSIKAWNVVLNDHLLSQCVCVCVCVCVRARASAQLYLTLCNPRDCSLPGSSVHGIFQARILEWVAISYSRRYPQPRDRTQVSCISCIGRQILYHSPSWEAPLSHRRCLNQYKKPTRSI